MNGLIQINVPAVVLARLLYESVNHSPPDGVAPRWEELPDEYRDGEVSRTIEKIQQVMRDG